MLQLTANRKRLAMIGLLVVVLVLGVAHFWHWYAPRLRAHRPDPGSVVARLVLASPELSYNFWLPYPHQNLAYLEESLGGSEAILRAAGGLLDLKASFLPSFGPFRVPPAHELAIGISEDGREVLAAARMYPVAGWLLRAAGAVAGNSWLSGGNLTVDGRPFEVRWQSGVWVARTPGVGDPTGQSAVLDRHLLAAARLGARRGVVPAGLFGLFGDATSMRLELMPSGGSSAPWTGPLVVPPDGVSVWATLSADQAEVEAHAMALMPLEDLESTEVPPLVSLSRGPGPRWKLPAEKLLKTAGVEVLTAETAGWQLAAYEKTALARSMALASFLERLGREAVQDQLVGVVVLDLIEAQNVLRKVVAVLESIPIVGVNEARMWLDLLILLDSLERFRLLSVRIGSTPDRFEMVLSAAALN